MVLNPNTTVIAASANAITALLFLYVAYRLLKFWQKGRDPLSAALATSILLLGLGLAVEVASEVVTITVGVNALGNALTYAFFALFILSYPVLAYFSVGLFYPRNRWYLPTISFSGGFALAIILTQDIGYGPPPIAMAPFAALTLGLYVPLYMACRRTAPKAPMKVTQMKFVLVGRFAVLYIVTFILFGLTPFFGGEGQEFIGNLFFLLVAAVMMITVIHAWFGWAMPDFLRRRYSEDVPVVADQEDKQHSVQD
ncbi:MAG: hypothetical protein HXY34_09935 [Candidatus Thorarchaeota archaeon]|nr:hypothetical protein [Candidatus Thorarchaeota archaeon]